MIANGSIAIPLLPSLLAACVVFLIGSVLAQRVPLRERYSIPGPIVGGLIFATQFALGSTAAVSIDLTLERAGLDRKLKRLGSISAYVNPAK